MVFRDAFALPEFRALWAAQLLSVSGDQLARVALTVLVYDRTRSTLLASAVYAATIAPLFLGGTLLSGLADRWPRRNVMITCDLARVPLTALMAVPGTPVAALIALMCAVTALGAPFGSARAAIFPDVLGDAYPVGTAVTMTTYQLAQVVGFGAGGAMVSLAGAHVALLADSGTFVGSAALVWIWVRSRPAATAAHSSFSVQESLVPAVRFILSNRAVRTPMLLGWVSWAYNLPEGLAAPLARGIGGGPVAVSGIMAAAALGSSAGALAVTALGPAVRRKLTLPLSFTSCAVLTLIVLRPDFQVLLAILLVSGLCDAYQVETNASFVAAVPDSQRGQAFGLAIGGMQLGQGGVMIAAGAIAQRTGPESVIAVIGVAGAICAVLVAHSLCSVKAHPHEVFRIAASDPCPGPALAQLTAIISPLGAEPCPHVRLLTSSWGVQPQFIRCLSSGHISNSIAVYIRGRLHPG